MAAQKGSAMLIKHGTGSGSPEGMTTIAGLRSTDITLNDEIVDITNKDSSGVRELLVDGGIHSITISGSGVFTDTASEASLRGEMNAAAAQNYQFLIPDFGTYTGQFILTSLAYAGEYNGEVTYSCTFESSGATTFATV